VAAVPIPEPALETRPGRHQEDERPTAFGAVRVLGGLSPSTAVVDPESIGVFEESEDTVVDRPIVTDELDGDATLPEGRARPSNVRRR